MQIGEYGCYFTTTKEVSVAITLGWASEMNKSATEEKRQEFMLEINGGIRKTEAVRPPKVTEFLDQVYLPL